MKRNRTDARRAKGFTLVELIVVIAILGILAGGGAVAYSGYVTQVNKKADIALVGGVERALETGVNSFTFSVSELQQLADKGVEIPVGLIVLTNKPDGDGVSVRTLESASTAYNEGAECDIQTVKVYRSSYDKKDNGSTGFWIFKTYYYHYYYTLTLVGEYEICAKHSDITYSTINKSAGNGTNCNRYYYRIGSDGAYTENSASAYKYVSESDWRRSSIKYEGHPTLTTYVGGGQGGKYVSRDSGTLDEMLKAAYGANYADDLYLKYAGWNEEIDGSDVPTFYVDAKGTWNEMTNLLDSLFAVTDGEKAYTVPLKGTKIDIMGKSYGSQQEMLKAVADAFSNKSNFSELWDKAAESGTTDYAFGLASGTNREIYCTARKLYNDSFASYVSQYHSAGSAAAHAAQIRSFGDSGEDLMEEKGYGDYISAARIFAPELTNASFPRCLCNTAFETHYKNIEFTKCAECQKLYKEYTSGGANSACHANGEAVYEMMQSVSASIDDATTATSTAQQVYDYYNSYLQEFSGLYDTAAEIAKESDSSIMLFVYTDGGTLRCQVNPGSADPRK